MKYIIIFFLIPLFSACLSAQENSIMNIGVGMPVFFRQNFSEPEYAPLNLSRRRINLFVEKPIMLGSNHSFSIRPGLGYFLFNEDFESGGLGAHTYKNLTHYSLSSYSKLFYHFKFNAQKSNHYYCGIIGGKYILTKTTGKSSWYMLQESSYIGDSKVIDENGKSFFHSFYYGFIAGFNGKTNNNSLLAPVFEFSFYPYFISLEEKRRSMAIISVILILKKSYPKN